MDENAKLMSDKAGFQCVISLRNAVKTQGLTEIQIHFLQ